MAKTHMKRCSIPLIIRDIQIETAVSYDISAVGMAIRKKKSTKTDAGEGDVSCSIDRNVN